MRAWRKVAVATVALTLAIAFAIGLLQTAPPPSISGPPAPSIARARSQIDGAPGPLRALYAQSNVLLPEPAFAQLRTKLRGYPVVVNIWASYCGPCRREFALFRRAAAHYGTRVAFIGVDADATTGPGLAFLERNPTLYPHVQDPKGRLANLLDAGVVLPSTVILSARGDIATVFAGAYPGPERLAQDLARYGHITDAAQTKTDQKPVPSTGQRP